MGVTRAEGFNADILSDDDGNVISSTEGTTSTTLVADGTRRLAVDAFMSGGTITVAPTPNRESFTAFANAPGAGIGVQGPTVSVPDGFSLVVKNRSTNQAGTVLFVAPNLADLASAAGRVELLVGESVSFTLTNMNGVFYELNVDQFVEIFAEL